MRSLPSAAEPLRQLGARPFAHRGLHDASRGVPENSRAAFRAAIEAGFGIELDVQLSADGVAMVFHDETLERLTEAVGRVDERDAAALVAIRLRGADQTIPRLHDALDLVDGRVPLLIEVKAPRGLAADAASAVADALGDYLGPHGVMSFNPEVASWLRRWRPDCLRGLVLSRSHALGWRGDLQRRFAVWRAKPHFLACDVRDLPYPLTVRAQRDGVPVYCWTVRSPAQEAIAAAHGDQRIFERA